jgi:hypothetical protein
MSLDFIKQNRLTALNNMKINGDLNCGFKDILYK